MYFKRTTESILKNARIAVGLLSVLALLCASGCTIPFTSNVDVSTKDNNSYCHAMLQETVKPAADNEKDDKDEDEDENKQSSSNMTEGSFADRAAGVYRVEYNKKSSDDYIEFYNIGGNLYAFFSGEEHVGMELFSDEDTGFDENADTLNVTIIPIEEYGYDYYTPIKAKMTVNDEGIEFGQVDNDFSILLFDDTTKLVRTDSEVGHLDGFAYKDLCDAKKKCEELGIETLDEIPKEVIGSWILLGDIDEGIVIEFSEDGYMQAFLKNYGVPILLSRGDFVAGKEEINGGTNLYIDLLYLSDDDQGYFNFCYVEDTGLLMLKEGNTEYGGDVAWEDSLFVPFDYSSFGRQYYSGYEGASMFSDVSGSYISDDGEMILLTSDGYFYHYDSDVFTEISEMVEGYVSETPGGLEVYELNYQGGDDELYGFIAFMEEGVFDFTEYDTNKTKRYELIY